MKHYYLILFLLCCATSMFSQQTVEELVQEGVQHHDNGDYNKAIETYKQALKLEPKSDLVNYEIALSYFSKGDYEKTIEHSDIVLDQQTDLMVHAYLTKGSALDLLGKTKQSIKLFEKAIKKTGGNYLLYYNLAVNYYKLNDLADAEKNILKALEDHPNHPSSHWMLANIHNSKGNKVQSLLATYYFLFLEADTPRSPEAYRMLRQNFGGNVSRDEDKPNSINILLSPNNDSKFGAAEMMISMLEAAKYTEENQEKNDDQLFVSNTGSFFTILGELQENDEQEDLWWSFYTPFFYQLAKSEHLETYCMFISQSSNENSRKWMDENEVKLYAFGEWLKDM